nr:AsmA family protein [uncultured Cohaesibacter sp.]
MTRTMWIRILWSFLAFVAFVFALVMATPYLINTKVAKSQISQQISYWMGLPVTVRGEPVVTIFPYLTVKLRDLEIASNLDGEGPPLVSMKALRAELYWLPLLFGNFEVRRFNLIEPQFEFLRDQKGTTSWDLSRGSLFHVDENTGRITLTDLKLGNFRISTGSAHYRDELSGQEERFSDINLGFNWPRTEAAASIGGKALWRDNEIELRASSGKPMELFAGGLSPLSLNVTSPLFKMSLDGSAATMSNFQFEGDFSFETASVGKLLKWMGQDLPKDHGMETASLTARANLVGASVGFSDLDMLLDKKRINGVLQLDFRQKRPLIQGTLASDELDLGQFIELPSSLDELASFDLTKSKAAIADFDVRLSATDLKLGPVTLGRAATSLMTRDNQVSISIGEAYAYGGRLEATFEMKPDSDDPAKMSCTMRAKANGVMAGGVLHELVGDEAVTGTTLMEMDLQSDGTYLGEAFSNAHGNMSVVLTDGQLNHFDLNAFAAALQDGKDIDNGKLYKGQSKFDVLSVRGSLSDRALDVEGVRLTSGKRALSGTASYGFDDGKLNFPGSLAIYRSSDPATHSTEAPEKEIPFLLQGGFNGGQISLQKAKVNAVPDAKDILAPGVPTEINPAFERGKANEQEFSQGVDQKADQAAASEAPLEMPKQAEKTQPATKQPDGETIPSVPFSFKPPDTGLSIAEPSVIP